MQKKIKIGGILFLLFVLSVSGYLIYNKSFFLLTLFLFSIVYLVFSIAVVSNWGEKQLFAKRSSIMLLIILFFLIVYALRLLGIQYLQKSKYVALMNEQLLSINKEIGQRGLIYDNKGKKLAFNNRKYTISINPSLLNDEKIHDEIIKDIVAIRDSKIVKLEENYRSTTTILDAANELIKNNKSSKDKKLWTQNGKGDLIKVLACDNGRDEVSRIIEIIKENHQNGIPYGDMTILYRTNAQSRVFEEGLLRYSIPHKIFGGISFYSRAEIKDIIAYLSIIVNPQDELNLQRIINVPKRKVGEKGIEKIIAYARENNLNLLEALSHIKEISGLTAVGKEKLLEMYDIIKELKDLAYTETASYIVQTLIDKIHYIDYINENYDDAEARIENIDEFKNSILELENVVGELRLNEYLENVSLISATDDLEEKSDYVKLMTIHNSKGLEFPIVFLVGFENEIFPGTRAMLDEKEMEEERRLCYVALTRAEKKLYLSHVTIRFVYGQDRLSTPSVFLKEIPEKLLDIEVKKERLYFADDYSDEINTYGNNKKFEKKKTEINTKNTIKLDENTKKVIDNLGFKVGDKVRHKKFGLGVIKSIDTKKIYVQYVDGTKEMALILADKLLTKSE